MGCSSSAKKPAEDGEFHLSYKLGPKLGKGAFAQVRSATKVSTSSNCAVKILDMMPRKADDASAVARIRKAAQHEVNIHKRVGAHQYIVQIFEAFFEERVCYIVMELCSSGLLAYLDQMPELNERTVGVIFNMMLVSIAHVHAAGVCHRDVKPDNFLCDYGTAGNAGTVKLCDFGLADAVPKTGVMGRVYGTAPYMSPEMLASTGYNAKTDVWSFGVVAYVLLLGQFPYVPTDKSATGMKRAISEGRVEPPFTPNIKLGSVKPPSQTATNYIRALLQRDPVNRPTAQEALDASVLDNFTADQPTLRPVLQQARRVGAFENRPVNKADDDGLDNTLNAMQVKHQGQPIPAATTTFISSLEKEKNARQAARDARRTSKDQGGSQSGNPSEKSSDLPQGFVSSETISVWSRNTSNCF